MASPLPPPAATPAPAPAPAPALSKKQQRKKQKALWLAERKAARLAAADAGTAVPRRPRKRRNQRSAHVSTRPEAKPQFQYTVCSSSACPNRAVGCVVRHVVPYVHRFALHAKGRWAGRRLDELFSSEFAALSPSYTQRAVESGLVRLNGAQVTLADCVQEGDFLEHVLHRHEPAVHLPTTAAIASSVQKSESQEPMLALTSHWICYESAELLVVNKPAGLPVHPSGGFRFNSLTLLLERERQQENGDEPESLRLFPVHRLDRLTSGLLLLAKTPQTARELTAELSATSFSSTASSSAAVTTRAVKKHYVARVQGLFPLVPSTITAGEHPNEHQETVMMAFGHVRGLQDGLVCVSQTQDGYWRVTAPLGTLSHRYGHIQGVTIDAADSKPCETLLRRRSDLCGGEGESIVECVPVTGRTHQIRAHLQHLGFPIANDPLYGPSTDMNVSGHQQVVDTRHQQVDESVIVAVKNEVGVGGQDATERDEDEDESEEQRCARVCETCRQRQVPGSDATEGDAPLWLHAYRYESSHGCFSVPLPLWTQPVEGLERFSNT